MIPFACLHRTGVRKTHLQESRREACASAIVFFPLLSLSFLSFALFLAVHETDGFE